MKLRNPSRAGPIIGRVIGKGQSGQVNTLVGQVITGKSGVYFSERSKSAGEGGDIQYTRTISIRHHPFGTLEFDAESVAVASARTNMPGMIRASAEAGRIFIIENNRSASARPTLLINPDVLQQHLAAARPRRTLGQLLETLPFKRRGAPRLTVALTDDEAPELQVHPARELPAGGEADSHGPAAHQRRGAGA